MHIIVTLTSALVAFGCAGNTIAQPPANATTDRANAFVVSAQRAYVAHLQAEQAGDVTLYRRSRAKEAVDETLANLRKHGKTERELGSFLQSLSRHSLPLDGFRFLRAEGSGSVGRLLYRRDWQQSGIETVDFLGYVVRLEEGLWKVDCVINSTGTRIGVSSGGKLEERTVDEIRNHRCLAIK